MYGLLQMRLQLRFKRWIIFHIREFLNVQSLSIRPCYFTPRVFFSLRAGLLLEEDGERERQSLLLSWTCSHSCFVSIRPLARVYSSGSQRIRSAFCLLTHAAQSSWHVHTCGRYSGWFERGVERVWSMQAALDEIHQCTYSLLCTLLTFCIYTWGSSS